jgi:hypothetical protein
MLGFFDADQGVREISFLIEYPGKKEMGFSVPGEFFQAFEKLFFRILDVSFLEGIDSFSQIFLGGSVFLDEIAVIAQRRFERKERMDKYENKKDQKKAGYCEKFRSMQFILPRWTFFIIAWESKLFNFPNSIQS